MQANLIKFVLKSTCSATILTYLMAPLKLQSLVQLFNDGVSDQYLLTRQKKIVYAPPTFIVLNS